MARKCLASTPTPNLEPSTQSSAIVAPQSQTAISSAPDLDVQTSVHTDQSSTSNSQPMASIPPTLQFSPPPPVRELRLEAQGLDFSQHLPLASSVNIHLTPSEVSQLVRLSFSQFTEQRLLICLTHSRVAFCVKCPRPLMASLSQASASNTATFEPIPRHFHSNPLVRELAIRHFRTVHMESFPRGVKDMVIRYGKMGKWIWR